MGYIVSNELPKSCIKCQYCYLIMQNPLSSKKPIKRYRCQVGKAPWRTFDVDFYDAEYKDDNCPLVPVEEVVNQIQELANEFQEGYYHEAHCKNREDNCEGKDCCACVLERAIEIINGMKEGELND